MVARIHVAALAAAALTCLALLAPPPASAAFYDVHVCTNLSEEGLLFHVHGAGNIGNADRCGTPSADIQQGGAGNTVGDIAWELDSPSANVHIHALSADVTFAGEWGNMQWNLTNEHFDTLAIFNGGPTLPPSGPRTYVVDTPGPLAGAFVFSTLACPNANGCTTGSGFSVTFKDLVAQMEDDAAPTITGLTGSLVAGDVLSGVKTVSFGASDSGSGVAKAAVLVDGTENVSFSDDNGGKCTVPYESLLPCAASDNFVFTVDTTQIPDGTHTMEAEALDATGQATKFRPVTITVHNAPTSTAPPAIQGTVKLGSKLTATTGTWDGNPTKFAFQWLRCPASVTSAAGAGGCKAIAGATSAQYTLTSADIYGRVIVNVTASNVSVTHADAFSAPSGVVADANGRTTPPPGGGGTGGGGGGTGTLDTTAPVLSAVSLTHARFGVSRSRAAIAAFVRGTLLRLTSSEGGQLSIAVVRVRPGQRRGTVCRAVRRPVARGRCTALTRVATLTRSIGAGRSSIALSGRIGSKALAAGSYRLVLTVRDGAGNVSKAVQRSFTILSG